MQNKGSGIWLSTRREIWREAGSHTCQSMTLLCHRLSVPYPGLEADLVDFSGLPCYLCVYAYFIGPHTLSFYLKITPVIFFFFFFYS